MRPAPPPAVAHVMTKVAMIAAANKISAYSVVACPRERCRDSIFICSLRSRVDGGRGKMKVMKIGKDQWKNGQKNERRQDTEHHGQGQLRG